MISQANYSTLVLLIVSISALISVITIPQSMPPLKIKPTTTPRKTLINKDKRRIYLYYKEHSVVKQIKIEYKSSQPCAA